MTTKRMVALAALAMAVGAGTASAGNVCVNNDCESVPGVYGNVSYSLTGQAKAMGGLTGGPGVGTTGATVHYIKSDYIAFTPEVNGDNQGLWSVTIDYADEVIRINLGDYGCTQIGDGVILGPCFNDPDQ